MLRLLLTFVVLGIACTHQPQAAEAPVPPHRFHRYSQVYIDATTRIDVIKDSFTGYCATVYVVQRGGEIHGTSAATLLGVVPC